MSRFALRLLFAFLLHEGYASSGLAQCTGNDLADSEGYRVRSVRVETLFGRAPEKLQELLARHQGERFTGEKREAYRAEVNRFFSENSESIEKDQRFGATQLNSLYIRGTLSTDCIQIVPASECASLTADSTGGVVIRCVDIILKIRVLPINTASLSSNLLDLARSNKLRFYRDLPRPLIAFNPTVWFEQDRAYGSALAGSVATDLLTTPAILRGEGSYPANHRLLFAFAGSKSLTDPFHTTTTSLALARAHPFRNVDNMRLETDYVANRQPQGTGTLHTNIFRVRGQTLIRFPSRAMEQLGISAGYRRAQNTFTAEASSEDTWRENSLETQLITEGRLASGFTRAAVWFDAAGLEKGAGTYQRLAATWGYSRNFIFSSPKCRMEIIQGIPTCVYPSQNAPSIGLEILLSAGRAWGNVPRYAQFYGGNSPGNFLYQSVTNPGLVALPAGPLIRSYGRNEQQIDQPSSVSPLGTGGKAYWNVSTTVTLPFPRFSRPLIPPEVVNDAASCEDCQSLKDVLKKQVAGGKNVLIDVLAIQKLTNAQRVDLTLSPDDSLSVEEQSRLEKANRAFEQARIDVQPEAEKLWKQITPAIGFIADQADLFSVKPILMFDVARLFSPGESGGRTQLGLGGGLQLNVVVAKFEVGYLRTLHYQPGDARGNFTVRLIFEKIL